MKYENKSVLMTKVIQDVRDGLINPDPIGQRPAVTSGPKKAQGIIDSVLNGFSIGAITVRDIIGDDKNRKVYPDVDWLVIDGGNRIRALRDFQNGKVITTDGRSYLSLTEKEKDLFDGTKLTFQVYKCDNHEATEIFRRLNTVTPVNKIEMIMANDISQITKEIRSRVKSYKEYGYNKTQKIFDIATKTDGTLKPTHWQTDINPRRKWDEYVAIVLIKSMNKGNVAAGLDEIESFAEEDPVITAKVSKTADTFFDDALKVIESVGKMMNGDVFGAFQAVWFELLERNEVFAINNYDKFAKEFFKAHTILTGSKTSNAFDTKVMEFTTGERGSTKTKHEIVKKFIRQAIKYPSNPSQQHEAASMYLDEMDIDSCVLFRDTRRTVTKDKKFELLANQNFRCAIDGEPLDIDDAIFGHDTPWSKGGVIEDGAIIRKVHNVNMGTATLDEYRTILKLRASA